MSCRTSAALLPLLLASCAAGPRPAPPSPFGPAVKSLAIRYVEAPDAISVRTDEIAIGSAVVSTAIFGLVLGGVAAVTDDMKGSTSAKVQAEQLLLENRATLERFGFAARVAADSRDELERYGWVRLVGADAPLAPDADVDAELRASGADALLVVRPRLRFEERARFARLWVEADAYERDADGALRHLRTLDRYGKVSRHGVDGKKSPPSTQDGQTLKFGRMWLSDDAARLRAEYAVLAADRVSRALTRLRDRSSEDWNLTDDVLSQERTDRP